jgi:hypothetical protein
MFLMDLLFALVIGVLFTVLFAVLFRARGPWASLLVFFFIVFLAAWTGGLWLDPFGPPLFGVYWLPFLLIGLFFALLLAAATPPVPRTRTEAVVEAKASALAFNVFFWVLIVGLIVAVLVAYI